MNHLRGADRKSQDFVRHAGCDLDELERKFPGICAGARKEHLARRIEPLARARRTGNGQRARAQAQQLGVEQEERQRAKVVAVQMAENNAVYRVRVDVPGLKGDKR